MGCVDVTLIEPAQQPCGHKLGLFPLVLSQIFIAAPLNCMHLSSFYQEDRLSDQRPLL